MPVDDRRIHAPIVYLPLAAPASDDRTFNTWADFLSLLPLMDEDADRCEADEALARG